MCALGHSPAGPLASAIGQAGLAGLSQPIWAELGPAPKKYICWAGLARPKKIKK